MTQVQNETPGRYSAVGSRRPAASQQQASPERERAVRTLGQRAVAGGNWERMDCGQVSPSFKFLPPAIVRLTSKHFPKPWAVFGFEEHGSLSLGRA